MVSRPCVRAARRVTVLASRQQIQVRPFTRTALLSDAQPSSRTSDGSPRTTHFGFETVTEDEKTKRVAGVFHSVAESYDKMNDLMSFGWHRVWKDQFVSGLSAGLVPAGPNTELRLLDIAGGTGDIAFRLLRQSIDVHRHPSVHLTISDINPSMLQVGRSRSESLPISHQAALSFLVADATQLPSSIPDNSVDLYTVAFGIRNFTDIPAALREAHRVLRPGGVFACLEFSAVQGNPLLDAVYKRWSFSAIPLIGHVIAGDRDSYQYLVESIERFPSRSSSVI
ncbi:unnamed protein product [Parascedosporium putredinis]|uniref:Ubiquinone biosynthesis methyltransferase COQ5 n=1 Tax=Parascedosporium putredinis TaxID=1442378 RepID=A0A9P1HCG8_9PEZI|nr:unnamed protein product [Parascedosporium putredinis]CAI8004750.1 unnamed protein product [Parascedosporium putredinis]